MDAITEYSSKLLRRKSTRSRSRPPPPRNDTKRFVLNPMPALTAVGSMTGEGSDIVLIRAGTPNTSPFLATLTATCDIVACVKTFVTDGTIIPQQLPLFFLGGVCVYPKFSVFAFLVAFRANETSTFWLCVPRWAVETVFLVGCLRQTSLFVCADGWLRVQRMSKDSISFHSFRKVRFLIPYPKTDKN